MHKMMKKNYESMYRYKPEEKKGAEINRIAKYTFTNHFKDNKYQDNIHFIYLNNIYKKEKKKHLQQRYKRT